MEGLTRGYIADHPRQDVRRVSGVAKKQITVGRQIISMYQGSEQARSGRAPGVGQQSCVIDIGLFLSRQPQFLCDAHSHVAHSENIPHGLAGPQVRG